MIPDLVRWVSHVRVRVPWLCAALWCNALAAHAQLPPSVQAALARAQIGADSAAFWVAEAGRANLPLLAHRAQIPMNPASVMKLVTTGAAFELLGTGYTWTTSMTLGGPVRDGVLDGPLFIRGGGDPALVIERLWLMLARLQREGIRTIRGDIVLDRSLFQVGEVDPGAFDGERLRAYNVRPDALMINFKSATYTLRPDAARNVAVVSVEPALDGVRVDATVPLSNGPCGDWRSALGADFSDAARVRFAGRFSVNCGEKAWPLAFADARSYNARVIAALWKSLGGTLAGQVRDGTVPQGMVPSFEFASPALAEVARDMNKFSNNVMAHQVFLTLGATQAGRGTWDAAREVVGQWLRTRGSCTADEFRLDNGSGLSRDERLTAHCLGQMLNTLWNGPAMPELLASLPVAGEGTAKRAKSAAGRAHLKTGTIDGVTALAGIVHAASGRRYVMVAMINHPNAGTGAARAVLDEVLRLTLEESLRSGRGESAAP
jgi:serine-type D-Ala-D-Ala carboxypeptidase/endopeptidase (penicillin-binding protein 4)